ncbi:MAG: MOSC N-terminal beta barrel domain-containing protein [Deltaproteobacteria bacterium]|nr:MOSC N-terminal beta barrel domain-containing protein [Deltaproteobacteria bacterium]
MREVGSIAAIFRYPVKSMLGEELDASTLGENGIPGDRAWGVRDEVRGDFFVGKRSAGLMSCSAWYADPADTRAVPQIRLPDGETFLADAEGAAERVGKAVGREVTLWPVVPEARKAKPRDNVSLLDEMRDLMAREEGEPMPDFSNPSPELLEVYARKGPFFDAFPLLLVTQRSLESLAATSPDSQMDTAESGSFPEQDWIGRRVRIGSAVLSIQSTCIRCVMTTHGFADVSKEPQVMRTLVKEAEGNLGVYATVDEPGEIRPTDPVTLLD